MSLDTVTERAACPDCGAGVELAANTEVTEIVVCAGCSVELEVVAVGPVTLALAPEIEEDWGE
ncbi:lysine biosynthesis protein LysW [Streptomyces sp. NPDC003444]|uniref:lysine biosynthesis protein LysW n=1 Tax=Streptomyces TaxID=1883 RepID=UPI000EF84FFA|nr:MULTISPECIES: lysine biosynthesis protein LysW [unclassified Streptomyces]MZE52158.1 lysine biosynthesis protein LysW [Streptomyces sp. SID5770]